MADKLMFHVTRHFVPFEGLVLTLFADDGPEWPEVVATGRYTLEHSFDAETVALAQDYFTGYCDQAFGRPYGGRDLDGVALVQGAPVPRAQAYQDGWDEGGP